LTFCHLVELFPHLRSTFCILQLERDRTPIRHQPIDESALLLAAKTCKTPAQPRFSVQLTRKQSKRETGPRSQPFASPTSSSTPSHRGPCTHTSIQLPDSTSCITSYTSFVRQKQTRNCLLCSYVEFLHIFLLCVRSAFLPLLPHLRQSVLALAPKAQIQTIAALAQQPFQRRPASTQLPPNSVTSQYCNTKEVRALNAQRLNLTSASRVS
jgi:hypothetical protein